MPEQEGPDLGKQKDLQDKVNQSAAQEANIHRETGKVIDENTEKQQNFSQEILKALQGTQDLSKEVLNVGKEIYGNTDAAKAFSKVAQDINDISKNTYKEMAKAKSGKKGLWDIEKEIYQNSKRGNILTKAENDLGKQIQSKKKAIQKIVNDNINKRGKGIKLSKDDLKASSDKIAKLKEQIIGYEGVGTKLAELKQRHEKNTAELEKQQRQIKANNDIFVQGLKTVGNVMEKLGFAEVGKNFNKVADSLRDAKAEGLGLAGQTQAVLFSLGDIIKHLLMMTTIGAAMEFSAETTQMRKDMGISQEEAEKTWSNMIKLRKEAGLTSVYSSEIAASMSMLQDQFGVAAKGMEAISMEAAKLQKLYGMSADSAARFAISSNITGVEAAKQTTLALKQVKSISQEFGIRLKMNKMLEKAGKIQGQLASAFGNNVVEITKAVALAHAFGLELEQVEKAGSGLLNFEQSISNELEAELLTGKQLNLEKARMYALTKDYEGLTREINANVGDFNDWQGMNVLQQNAIAAALGMSSDEISDMLMKQENIGALKEEELSIDEKQLEQNLEARNLMEEIRDTLNEAKEAVKATFQNESVQEFIQNIKDGVKWMGEFIRKLKIGQGGWMDMLLVGGMIGSLLSGPINLAITVIGGLFKGIMWTVKGIGKALGFNLGVKEAETIQDTKQLALEKKKNMTKKKGNTLEQKGFMWKVKKFIKTSAQWVKEKAINMVNKARNVLAKINLGLLVKQGAALVKNIAKGALNLAKNIASAIARAWSAAMATFGAMPLVGIGLATAAAVAAGLAIRSATKSVEDGAIDEKGGLMLSGAKGSFTAHKDDQAILTPDAKGLLEAAQSATIKPPITTTSNVNASKALVDALNVMKDELKNKFDELGEKPGLQEERTVQAPKEPWDSNMQHSYFGVNQRQQEGQMSFT